MRWWFLLLVGCGTSDPCDPFPAQTCLSLEVRGPALPMDQIGVTASGFTLTSGRSPSPPRSLQLPVQVAVLPPDPQFAGAFELEVEGLFQGQPQAGDDLHSTVRAGEHLRLIADLLPLGGDGPVVDLAAVDLAGADFAGADLTVPPVVDLARVDLSGADLSPASGWQVEALPQGISFIKAIFGTSSTNVYALDTSGDIVHSNGDGTWQVQRLGGTGTAFSCLGGSGADDLYAGGGILNCTGTCPSVLVHSTGDGTWTTVPVSPTESTKGLTVMAIAANSKSDVYLGVWGGTKNIYHSVDGMTWNPQNDSDLVESLYAEGATSIFAASASSTVLHSIGDGTWQIVDTISGCRDSFLFGTSGSNLYSICDTLSNTEGGFFRFSGAGKFAPQTIDDGDFNGKAVGMSGHGAFDLYGAFLFAIKHSGGDGHWKSEALPAGIGEISSIWAAPDGQVFAGTSDEILHKR